MKLASIALGLAAVLAVTRPAAAQESSYTPTTVWQISDIKVEPGQFENYLDYLDSHYKKQMQLGMQMGDIVSYHVFQVNSPRKDDPDIVLAVEYKDYVPVAEQLVIQKKLEAALAMDAHQVETASGARAKMRTQMGGMELQELKLK